MHTKDLGLERGKCMLNKKALIIGCSGNKVLQIVDFKSWARSHRDWWNNPIDKYSNKDTYDEKIVEIINKCVV